MTCDNFMIRVSSRFKGHEKKYSIFPHFLLTMIANMISFTFTVSCFLIRIKNKSDNKPI